MINEIVFRSLRKENKSENKLTSVPTQIDETAGIIMLCAVVQRKDQRMQNIRENKATYEKKHKKCHKELLNSHRLCAKTQDR